MIPNQLLAVHGRLIGSYLHGSIAYGTDTINSDRDERHIYIQSKQTILADRYLPHLFVKPDINYYEVQFFLQQLWKGNFNMLDLLHSPVDCIIFEGSDIKKLKDLSPMFIHKGTVSAMLGAVVSNVNYSDKRNLSWEDAKARKKLAEAQRLLWKATSALEGQWYVREPSYRAEQLIKIKLGTESESVMDDLKKDIKKSVENLEDSNLFRKLPPQPYMSEYHNLLLKIREGRL